MPPGAAVMFIKKINAKYRLHTLPAASRLTKPPTPWDGKMNISFQAE